MISAYIVSVDPVLVSKRLDHLPLEYRTRKKLGSSPGGTRRLGGKERTKILGRIQDDNNLGVTF
jgi:hypothetical protein